MGMKKLLRWSVLNNIMIKKIVRKLEKTYLPICRMQDSIFQSSVLEELYTVARQVGLMPDFKDHITEDVSEGSIHFEHSYCLKIHISSCSWQQYYPVLSILITGNLHSDDKRVGGLLVFPACQ